MKEQNNNIQIKLKNCNDKLKSLLNITLAINKNLSIKKLLHLYAQILIKELNIPKFALFWLFNKKWRLVVKSHVVYQDYKNINIEKLEKFDDIEITYVHTDLNINFDFVIPIIQNKQKVAFLLIGDIDEGLGMSPSLKHMQFVQTLTNIIIVAIQNKLLVIKAIKEQQIKKEMETAAQIQQMLIPNQEDFPQINGINIKAFYQPHYEVGGDFYDVIRISKYEFYFTIADVSGKGVPAALLMANFQANLRSLIYNKNKTNIEELIVELNRIVNKIANGDRFISMFLAKYNALKGRLIYVNAGHPAPLLFDNKTNQITELKEGCPGIGMLKDLKQVKIGKFKIRNNAKLLCFTDGFYEPLLLNNQQAKQIIYNLLSSENSINNIIDTIIRSLNISKENKTFQDDVSILGLEFFPLLGWANI